MLNDKINKINEAFGKKRDEFLEKWENYRKDAIATATVNDVIENLSNMSVGNVISIFENAAPEILKTKGGKTRINDFVKMVRENRNLQNCYMLKENVFSFEGGCTARNVLDESINTAKETGDAKSFKKSKSDIVKFVAESLKTVDAGKIYDKIVLDENTAKINDNLELLVWGKKTVKNAGVRTNCINETVDFMHGNNLPSHIVTGKSNEDIFEEYKNKCINTINEAWKTAEDTNVRLKLTEMKDMISKKSYSEVTVDNDIKYLKEIINTVK